MGGESDTPEGTEGDVAALKAHMLKLLHEKKTERAKREALQERVRQLEGAAAIRGHRAGEPPSEEPLTPREALLESAAERLAGLEGAAYAAELRKLRVEADELLAPELAAVRTRVAGEYEPQLQHLKTNIERLTKQSAARRFISEHRRAGVAVELLEPTVLPRFAATWTRAGECIATPVDAEGAPMSSEALAAELQANPVLGPVLEGASPEEASRRRALVDEALH